MWLRPNIAVVCLCLLLSACGFEPLYGTNAAHSNSALQGNIAIEPISGRTGQIFKITLEDRLNPESSNTANAPYRLRITLQKDLIPAVVKSDGTIQRYDVRISSNFQLVMANDAKKVLLSGSLQRTGSYNVATNANFATYEAEQDITQRTLEELAEDYVLRLTGYFAGKS